MHVDDLLSKYKYDAEQYKEFCAAFNKRLLWESGGIGLTEGCMRGLLVRAYMCTEWVTRAYGGTGG